jgi:hypothetical protein
MPIPIATGTLANPGDVIAATLGNTGVGQGSDSRAVLSFSGAFQNAVVAVEAVPRGQPMNPPGLSNTAPSRRRRSRPGFGSRPPRRPRGCCLCAAPALARPASLLSRPAGAGRAAGSGGTSRRSVPDPSEGAEQGPQASRPLRRATAGSEAAKGAGCLRPAPAFCPVTGACASGEQPSRLRRNGLRLLCVPLYAKWDGPAFTGIYENLRAFSRWKRAAPDWLPMAQPPCRMAGCDS